MGFMKMGLKKVLSVALVGVLSVGLLAGCQGKKAETKEEEKGLKGTIAIDGSSTVGPITEAIGEEFQKVNQGVRITVGVSGTGGGMEKLIAKEIDIADASRTIKPEEADKAKANGVDYKEFKVAFDGISVVVNKDNTWVDKLTVDELKKIWEPNSTVKTWKDVRPNWPAEPIKLYGPGSDSGTFDYFTETIVGKDGAIRADYTASEDDNVLVTGVEGDKGSLGYFGYSYYVANKGKLKIVPIDSGSGAVEPTNETIEKGTYKPFSRPLYVYVNKSALNKPEIKEFMKYYLTEGKELIQDVGYVKLPQAEYDKDLAELGK